MSTAERTDEERMALLCDGDKSALEELVRLYQQDIFRFSLHYLKDAERSLEITQETFIRVYVARNRFDRTRSFKPWLLCIARNLCLNDLKRQKTVPMVSLEDYGGAQTEFQRNDLHGETRSPDEGLIDDERRQMLTQALDGLDDTAREIVTLRFFERLSAREIAEVVNMTEGAVRTRLHRILRSLRDKYEGIKDTI